mgnify:CR=1 FL=1
MYRIRGSGYSKYRNQKTNGFDSKREAIRYQELNILVRKGVIQNLQKQVPFELLEKTETERAIKYVADFYYYDKSYPSEQRRWVVEDVKGFRTQVYRIKRKLFKYKFPEIEFREI